MTTNRKKILNQLNFNFKQKNKTLFFFFLLMFSVMVSCSFIDQNLFGKKTFNSPDKDRLLFEVIRYFVGTGHFNRENIRVNDEFSKKVFDGYLEVLDGQKRYFTYADYEDFKKYELRLDDDFMRYDFSFFEMSHRRFSERLTKIEGYINEVSQMDFDFSKQEQVNLDYDNLKFAKNEAELKDYWRKIIKYTTLTNLVIKEKQEEAKLKKDPKYKKIAWETMVNEAKESSKKTFLEMISSIKDLTRDEWFAIYINAHTEVFDQHTNYMAPDIEENFNRQMAGKFEGIGAVLQKKPEGIRISNIMLGGPVWKGKHLEVGDIILKVGNGNEPSVDVVGMRLDEAIKLIKGPKDTQVKLTVRRIDGTIQEVVITRGIVELEETYAKSMLIDYNNATYAMVHLPSFYFNVEDRKDRNSSKDIKKELEKLNKTQAKGLIFDLRGNGGGSLSAVQEIVGYFIDQGPVVQVKNYNGSIQVLSDKNAGTLWEKPMVILVDEASASASEIFSAAMQDYQRALILGSQQTHGKGTVQTIAHLNDNVRNSKYDLGALKLTIQKYYRINGGSTQKKGVNSDIVIPSRYKYLEIGEKYDKNSMEWDKITSTDYKELNNKKYFEEAIKQSKERIEKNPIFNLIDENAKWISQQRDDKLLSLNYNIYKERIKNDEEISKKFKVIKDYSSVLKFYEMKNTSEREEDKIRQERWKEALKQDPVVEEATKVLEFLASKK